MENLLRRITFDKDVLCGKPVVRGLRISVEMILDLLAKGTSWREILEDYPELEADDIQAALLYAHHLVAGETIFERVMA
ncbi:MAG: DUF433 domain-containing protein [Chloroflexi bacterium]|nr:DUF433 domain-containing protein [Chloroflexota bacterium]